MTFRRLSVPTLLGLIAKTRTNILIIGAKNIWLINAKTPNKRHFVGTRKLLSASVNSTSKTYWNKIEDFVLRYASIGSTIRAYCLD